MTVETYTCKYCKASFKHEKTIFSHLCEKKRRMMGKDDKQNRLAFAVWTRFNKYCFAYMGEKSYDDFTSNQYYLAFMKFAAYLIDLKPYNMEDFIDFVIKNGVKLDDWGKAWVYETWVSNISKKETVDRAVERCVMLMQDWAEENDTDWKQFFGQVGTGNAVQWIRTGRLSPWILYSTDQGQKLISRLNDEQLELVVGSIDPKFWSFKVARHKKDAKWIQDIFNQYGIE